MHWPIHITVWATTYHTIDGRTTHASKVSTQESKQRTQSSEASTQVSKPHIAQQKDTENPTRHKTRNNPQQHDKIQRRPQKKAAAELAEHIAREAGDRILNFLD